MSDYNLSGLNPRDFEHLTQALAIKEIASGIVPFGDGPDGGREATFRGKTNYPSNADAWDGYLVIQSKFLTRPTGDTKKDGDWALQQLEADLKKFIDPKRELPKPDYYLLVTNVILTPVQDSGSKDKAYELLKQYKPQIGLKGYDIWDYDKLCRLLDSHTDISRRYGGFIMSGDVLARMMELIEGQQPNFIHVMSRYLQNELRADQFVKLEQAGHTADQKTSLANVFVDLPYAKQSLTDPPRDEEDPNNLPPGIVAEVLSAGSYTLRGSSFPRHTLTLFDGELVPEQQHGRFVVIGGPGQGKSTIGQFVCQLYRAAILHDRPRYNISPEAKTVLNLIQKQCQICNINLPDIRRFPVRVVLDQFASYLANGEVDSLLSFILNRIVKAANSECSIDALRRWLEAYPWLVVLDGLDEVPATSNREQVLEKINDFWTEVATLDADVMVIATTRPQGYNDDFSPRFYRHRYLTPLSPVRALHYARRLAEARYGAEPDRKRRVLRRLQLATEQDTTRRLMRTPLQVTIMATLVDQIGQPPQERWRLFQQYYEVIYRRETERDIPASIILQQRKSDVNAIHNRVGLLLQTESESAGNTESRISAEKFSQLVRARIAEEGFEGDHLRSRTEEILEAALQRLVFLVGLQENQIGFEIRSLQEFTAAEALMDGGDEQVRERLQAIASSAHWRNVFLFAAGKCFAERQFLRDMIVSICDQLNDPENDKLAGITYSGSHLALDILDDGVTREQPNYARSLARIALRLLDQDSGSEYMRIASVYEPSLMQVFQDKILPLLVSKDAAISRNAWYVLAGLYTRKIGWATDLFREQSPDDINLQYDLLMIILDSETDDWAYQKMLSLLPQKNCLMVGPSTIISNTPSNMARPEWLQGLNNVFYEYKSPNDLQVIYKLQENKDDNLVCSIESVHNDELSTLHSFPFMENSWAPFISAGRFAKDPSSETLARELEWLSKNWDMESNLYYFPNSPWPFHSCLTHCKSANDLFALSKLIKNGQCGQLENWVAAEERWIREGISEKDIKYLVTLNAPFDAAIGEIGFPLNNGTFTPPSQDIYSGFTELYNTYKEMPQSRVKSILAEILLNILLFGSVAKPSQVISLTPLQLKDLLLNGDVGMFRFSIMDLLSLSKPLSEEWISFFDWLGNQQYHFVVHSKSWKFSADLAQAYINNSQLTGLLVLLAYLVRSGNSISIPNNLLEYEKFQTDEQRGASLWLRLCNGELNAEGAEQIALLMATLPPNASRIFDIRRLHEQDISFNWKEFLLFSIRDHLTSIKFEMGDITAGPLLKLIRSRPSYIGKVTNWKKLGLPDLS